MSMKLIVEQLPRTEGGSTDFDDVSMFKNLCTFGESGEPARRWDLSPCFAIVNRLKCTGRAPRHAQCSVGWLETRDREGPAVGCAVIFAKSGPTRY